MTILLLCVAVLALGMGMGLRKVGHLTRRNADTIQPSSIASARGVVEISGVARAAEGARTRDPNGVPCIWHRVIIESHDGELREIEGGPPADPAAVDTILLDDGTGVCAMVIHNDRNFFEREVQKMDDGMRRVILRIRDGTKLFAVGRVERLAVRDRGATHRIEWDRSLHVAYSDRSVAVMARDLPLMRKLAIAGFVVGVPSLAGALYLFFRPLAD